MDFKINNDFKPKEVDAVKVRKNKEVSVSFSDVLSSKRTYTLPAFSETSLSSGSDKATISEASKIANYLLKIKSMVANIPDIREEKIKNAIELLKSGIENKKITKKIVETLANLLYD